jgi:hypothetical protein
LRASLLKNSLGPSHIGILMFSCAKITLEWMHNGQGSGYLS